MKNNYKIVIFFTLNIIIMRANAQGSQGSNLGRQIEDMYRSCKEKKSTCLGMPMNCAQQENCNYMVAISPSEDDMYKFAMLGIFDNQQDSNAGSYVAVGLSKDGRNMVNASIVSCSTGKIDLFWSKSTTTPEYVGINSGGYVQAGQWSPVDGKIYCQFRLASKFTEQGNHFDLDSQKYAVLLAKGPLKSDRNGSPGYHQMTKHLFQPMSLSKSSAVSMSTAFSIWLLICSVIISAVELSH